MKIKLFYPALLLCVLLSGCASTRINKASSPVEYNFFYSYFDQEPFNQLNNMLFFISYPNLVRSRVKAIEGNVYTYSIDKSDSTHVGTMTLGFSPEYVLVTKLQRFGSLDGWARYYHNVYDQEGGLAKRVWYNSDSTYSHSIVYSHDNRGQIVKAQYEDYPTPVELRFEYDEDMDMRTMEIDFRNKVQSYKINKQGIVYEEWEVQRTFFGLARTSPVLMWKKEFLDGCIKSMEFPIEYEKRSNPFPSRKKALFECNADNLIVKSTLGAIYPDRANIVPIDYENQTIEYNSSNLPIRFISRNEQGVEINVIIKYKYYE